MGPVSPALRAIRVVGGYREYAPPPALARVVDACWVYSGPSSLVRLGMTRTHRILPELGLSLRFHCWRDAAGRVTAAAVNFQGPIRAVQLFAPGGALHIEAVRIKPEWSRELFGADPAELANDLTSYRSLLGVRGDPLHDRLVRTTTSDQAVRILLDEVRELSDAVVLRRPLELAHVSAEMIRTSGAETRLADVARASGITERHLRRVIREATGIGAKRFQRIGRLNRAVAHADRSAQPTWSRIATESGYYDQSHMIQEFRELAGRAPMELHLERRAEEQTVSPSSAATRHLP